MAMKWAMVTAVAALVLVGCGADSSNPSTPGGSASTSSSGVTGTTSMGPTCPAESAMSPCPPQPVTAHLVVRDVQGSVVADTDSGPDGRFRIDVPPGSYSVTASVEQGVPMPQEKTQTVVVRHGSFVQVTLVFDSGIRAGGPAPVS